MTGSYLWCPASKHRTLVSSCAPGPGACSSLPSCSGVRGILPREFCRVWPASSYLVSRSQLALHCQPSRTAAWRHSEVESPGHAGLLEQSLLRKDTCAFFILSTYTANILLILIFGQRCLEVRVALFQAACLFIPCHHPHPSFFFWRHLSSPPWLS